MEKKSFNIHNILSTCCPSSSLKTCPLPCLKMDCITKAEFTPKDKSSNWAKVCADMFEDCSVDLRFALEKAARNSKKVFHKSNI